LIYAWIKLILEKIRKIQKKGISLQPLSKGGTTGMS